MEFTTSNGQKAVLINPAPFKKIGALRREVTLALKNAEVTKDVDGSILQNLELSKIIDKLFDLIINLGISENFENAILDCLEESIYDFRGKNLKITQQLFDDLPEAREDYYEIIIKCCEVNLRPFVKSLVSVFSTQLQRLTNESPKLE